MKQNTELQGNVQNQKSFIRSHVVEFLMCFSGRRRFTSDCQTHTRSQKNDVRVTDARYAVLGSGRGMSTSRIDPRKFLGGVSTLKGIQNFFGECATTVGGSTRSISVATNSKMDDFATIWKSLTCLFYSPEIGQGCTMRVS